MGQAGRRLDIYNSCLSLVTRLPSPLRNIHRLAIFYSQCLSLEGDNFRRISGDSFCPCAACGSSLVKLIFAVLGEFLPSAILLAIP